VNKPGAAGAALRSLDCFVPADQLRILRSGVLGRFSAAGSATSPRRRRIG
jgi:hypothetical protein